MRAGAAVAAAAALCLAAVAGSQFRPPQKASLEAFADRSSYASGEAVRIAAVITIEDGWHIQSNTPSFDYLIPTEIAFELPAGWPQPDVRYPDHVMWEFGFSEELLAVYEHEAVIHADLDLPADAPAGAVDVSAELTYQACDDIQCLPPVTAEATVSLEIGATGEPTGHPSLRRHAGRVGRHVLRRPWAVRGPDSWPCSAD